MKSIKDLYYEVRGLIGPAEFDRRIRNWLMRQLRFYQRDTEGERQETKGKIEQQCDEIISDLNNRYRSRYRVTDQVRKMVKYWIEHGKTVEDFKLVHQSRIDHWSEDLIMKQYIRPSTMYRQSHFDEYLAQAEYEKWESDKKLQKSKIKGIFNSKGKDDEENENRRGEEIREKWKKLIEEKRKRLSNMKID